MASALRAVTFNVAGKMVPVMDTDASTGKQTQRKNTDGTLKFNVHALDGSVNGVKATGTPNAIAIAAALCTAKVAAPLVKAAGDILGLLAKDDSSLKEAAKDVSTVAQGVKDADTMVTCITAPMSIFKGVVSVKDFVNASKDEKLGKGFALGSDVSKAIADGAKATRVIGNKVTDLGETVTTALTWATNAFRMITGVFDIAGAAHTLKKGDLLKEEKIAAIIKIAAAIVSIAFFAFLTVASLFSFGLAGTITAISLGTLFGLTMLAKGIYNCHVARVTSNHGQRALAQPPANIAALTADRDAEAAAKDLIVAGAKNNADKLAAANNENVLLVQTNHEVEARLTAMTTAQSIASDRATALAGENANMRDALRRAQEAQPQVAHHPAPPQQRQAVEPQVVHHAAPPQQRQAVEPQVVHHAAPPQQRQAVEPQVFLGGAQPQDHNDDLIDDDGHHTE